MSIQNWIVYAQKDEPITGFLRVLEIASPARREIVHHGHRLALREKVIDQVRADEACTTGHEYGRSGCHDEECPSGLRAMRGCQLSDRSTEYSAIAS